MKYDFDSCIDRTKVMSIKWSSKLRQEMYGESDVIPLGIADMDFKAAPETKSQGLFHQIQKAVTFCGLPHGADA